MDRSRFGLTRYSQREWEPTSHILSEGIQNRVQVKHGVAPRLLKEGVLNSVVSTLVRVAGISFTLLILFLFIGAFVAIYNGATGPLAIISFIIGAIFLDLFLCTAGIALWETSKWTKTSLRHFWNFTTPPHEEESLDILRRSPSGTMSILYDRLGISNVEPPRGDVSRIVESTLHLMTYGGFLVLLGTFGTAVFSRTGEISITNSVSLIVAIVSVFLGKVVGIIILGTVSISQSWSDMTLFTALIILPSIALAPAAKNVIRISEIFHHNIMVTNRRVGSLSEAGVSILLTVMWVGLLGFLGYRIVTSISI